MREHISAILDALPATTTPVERIMAAAEARPRHGLEIADMTTFPDFEKHDDSKVGEPGTS